MLLNRRFDLRDLLDFAQNLGVFLFCLLGQRLLLELPRRKECAAALVEHFDLRLGVLVSFWVCVLVNGSAKRLAHVYQVVHRKVAVSVVSFGRATERGFEGVRVGDVELLEHNHSPCRFLGLVDAEHAAVEAEVVAVFVEEPRKHFLLRREALQLQVRDSVADGCIWNWNSAFVLGCLDCRHWVWAESAGGVWTCLLS